MLIKKYKNKKVAKFATRRLRAFHPTSPGNFFMSQNTATATPFPHGVRLSVVVRDGDGLDNPGIFVKEARTQNIVHQVVDAELAKAKELAKA